MRSITASDRCGHATRRKLDATLLDYDGEIEVARSGFDDGSLSHENGTAVAAALAQGIGLSTR